MSLRHKLRVNKHKMYKKFYSWIIKRLAIHLLNTSSYIKRADGLVHLPLSITHYPEGHDIYPFCKESLKKYCYSQSKRYVGRFAEFIVGGDSESEVYLEVIKLIIFKETRVPFC